MCGNRPRLSLSLGAADAMVEMGDMQRRATLRTQLQQQVEQAERIGSTRDRDQEATIGVEEPRFLQEDAQGVAECVGHHKRVRAEGSRTLWSEQHPSPAFLVSEAGFEPAT